MADSDKIQLSVTLENGQLKIAAKDVQAALAGMGASANSAGAASEAGIGRMTKSFGGLTTLVKGFMGLQIVQFLFNIGKAALKGSAELEKNRIAFETLLGSAGKAKTLMTDIQTMAAKTPMETEDLVTGAKRLIAFGESEETVIGTMTRLGDAAMGQAEIFDRLTLAYGKTQAKQKATMEELNMFTEAGVPIVQALADKYGVSTAALMKMVEQGKVGFKDVDQALTNLTTGSGKFAGMMDKMSSSLGGRFSTFVDTIKMGLTGMGDVMAPVFKDLLGYLQQANDKTNMFGLAMKGVGAVIGTVANEVLRLIQFVDKVWTVSKVAYYTSKAWIQEQAGATAETVAATKKLAEDAKKESEYLEQQLSARNQYYIDLFSGKKDEAAGPDTGKKLPASSSGGGGGGPAKKGPSGANTQLGFVPLAESVKGYRVALEAATTAEDKLIAKAQGISAIASGFQNLANKVLSEMSNVFSMVDQREQQAIDDKMKRWDMAVDYWYTTEMKKQGLEEESTSKKNAKELQELNEQYARTGNAVKRAHLKDEIEAKRHEYQKNKLAEEAEEKKKKLELIHDVLNHQMAVKQFRRNQQMQYSQTTINMVTGMIGAVAQGVAMLGPIAGAIVGGIEAAAIGALGGWALSEIARQQPPMMAAGGHILGSQSGTTIIAGDRRGDETLVPLDNDEQMEKFREKAGTGVTIVNNFNGAVLDAEKGGRWLREIYAANGWKK